MNELVDIPSIEGNIWEPMYKWEVNVQTDKVLP